jgi:hypothetical protein
MVEFSFFRCDAAWATFCASIDNSSARLTAKTGLEHKENIVGFQGGKPRQAAPPQPLARDAPWPARYSQGLAGQGYAAASLLFALRLALRASRDIASWGVITHPLDDGVRKFYARYGFEDLPFDPRRAMAVRMADLERNGIAS